MHVHGCRPGRRITSASCSGGEAALMADLAHRIGLDLPAFGEETAARLHDVLGDRVAVRNPLDYHTYIWGDGDRLTECFTALLDAGLDQHLLMLDFPRADRCDVGEFETTVAAFESAQRKTGARACVVSSLPESMPEEIGRRLLDGGDRADAGHRRLPGRDRGGRPRGARPGRGRDDPAPAGPRRPCRRRRGHVGRGRGEGRARDVRRAGAGVGGLRRTSTSCRRSPPASGSRSCSRPCRPASPTSPTSAAS